MTLVEMYTDGGSRRNGEPDAVGAWAWVMLYKGKKVREGFKSDTSLLTNNQNELYAVVNGLHCINPSFPKDHPFTIRIFVDSIYVLKGATEWAPTWKANGWKKKKGAIQNIELWKALMHEMKRLRAYSPLVEIEFVKVKGHSGDKWNEYVDALVNGAMDIHIRSK